MPNVIRGLWGRYAIRASSGLQSSRSQIFSLRSVLLARRAVVLAFFGCADSRLKTIMIRLTLLCMLTACSPGGHVGPPEKVLEASGVVTLRARDDLSNSYSFERMDYGHVLVDRQIQNIDSLIGYHRWKSDSLSVPCSGGQSAAIVELGDLRDDKYGTSLFNALRLEGSGLVVPSSQDPGSHESSFPIPAPRAHMSHVTPKLGSIYIVVVQRGARDMASGHTYCVALQVVEHAESERVVIRWRML